VIPGLFGVDLGTLMLAWVLEILLLLALFGLAGFPFAAAGTAIVPWLLLLAAVKLTSLAVYVLIGLVIVMALLSLVNPFSPLMPVFSALATPLLRPFQRWVPTVANFDLSPLIFLLVCQLVIMLPLTWLERLASAHL
jgi:YggT family protein